MPSRSTSTASCDERSRSVSSMRRMNWPPVARANAHGYRAERILPRWMTPVGDGAKRVRVVMSGVFSQACATMPRMSCELDALAGDFYSVFDNRGGRRPAVEDVTSLFAPQAV